MHEPSDEQLLRRYAEEGDEAAYCEIVVRYTDLLYSAALRQVSSPDLARDVVQSVFTDLARKTRGTTQPLTPHSSLLGWLYRSTRFAALNQLREDRRRRARETQVMQDLQPGSETATDWERVQPLLDEAMSDLNEQDREALLQRFFKNRDFRTIGETLGVSGDAAQKRVSRALEKLRAELIRRGVTTTAVALSSVLSANAVQAAPAGLAATFSTVALAGTTVTTVTTAAKAIAMTTLQKAVIAATFTVVAGVGIYQTSQVSRLGDQVKALQQRQAPLAQQIQQLQRERDEATNRLAALRAENEQAQLGKNTAELLKLRNQVTLLQNSATDPSDLAAKDLVARVNKLKQRLEQSPNAGIPELQLLDEKDWLTAVRGWNLDTEADYRKALSGLRGIAEQTFANSAQGAIAKFARANDKQFPSDLLQLQPYFDPPMDPAILQRWEILPAGATIPGIGNEGPLITQKAPVDALLDRRFAVFSGGFGSTDFLNSEVQNVMQPVYQAFTAANNGTYQGDPAQLLPFATTSEQQAAVQKLIQQSAARK